MTKSRIAPLALATLVALGASFGLANAKGGSRQDQRDAAALSDMKLTLPQAIAAAEQSGGGRAVAADVTREHGVVAIKVELSGPQGSKTVLVDGQTGVVVATNDADGDGDGDTED